MQNHPTKLPKIKYIIDLELGISTFGVAKIFERWMRYKKKKSNYKTSCVKPPKITQKKTSIKPAYKNERKHKRE